MVGRTGGRGAVEKWGCKGRRSDPSGPDKAEWKTDECGERDGGGERRRGLERECTWEDILFVVPYHPHRAASPPFFFSPLLHFCLPNSRLKQKFVA